MTYLILSYCLRPSENDTYIYYSNITNYSDTHITFKTLYEQNITSEQLLNWSASIDLAERYQIYINRPNISIPSDDDLFVFHNCTWPWFGPFCRFSFDYEDEVSFSQVIIDHFDNKNRIFNRSKVTCYLHLQCATSLVCLDWRNICDGKMDCSNAADEIECWKLEMNECAANEFRCHNGQCIPENFFHDMVQDPDCLDRTDEELIPVEWMGCYEDPAFRCEEHTCRPGQFEFQCGDGQCAIEMDTICQNGRDNIIPNDSCSNIMACLTKTSDCDDNEWQQFCIKTNCVSDLCPTVFEFPTVPVLFGHVRLVFKSEEIMMDSDEIPLPYYVCYNEELCKDFLPKTVDLNDSTCRQFDQLGLSKIHSYKTLVSLVQNLKPIFQACSIVPNRTYDCNHPKAYQCRDSTKCISKHRLLDGIRDCPFNDDEQFNASCSLNDNHRFRCPDDGEKRCLSPLLFQDLHKDCRNGEDESITEKRFQTHIIFQFMCNGVEQISPMIIDGKNETDETECENWPCNNTYTLCNNFWTCKDGADEVNCKNSICSPLERMCILPNDLTKVQCLSIDRINDGVPDCIGGTDETHGCKFYIQGRSYGFHCQDNTKCIEWTSVCDKYVDCQFGDDEQFCTNYNANPETYVKFCREPITEVEKFLCTWQMARPTTRYYLTLHNLPTYPSYLMEGTSRQIFVHKQDKSLQRMPLTSVDNDWTWRCNRGLSIRVQINDDENKLQCLCPPSYYGDTCQYQNQRVSLTFQSRIASDWRTVFSFLIFLIDHDGKINSHDHIDYLPIRDCNMKFNVYLLYSRRPKDVTKKYSVRIDVFHKVTWNYRATWIFPILFSFLPVYRLAVQLIIPILPMESVQRCQPPCMHGQCIKYINTDNTFFCRCDNGWTGNQCAIKVKCNCALNSLCIDQSICVCPSGAFGRQCHLNQSVCQSNPCLNGGLCVSSHTRYLSEQVNSLTCVCPKGYAGTICEFRETRMDVSFIDSFIIPQSLFIHFIAANGEELHVQTTTMKRVPFDQNFITTYTLVPFNIAFAQIQNDYYLILLRELPIVSIDVSTEINPSHQCVPIEKVLNATIVNQHLLRRMKYFHIPCQENTDLICFYDRFHLCLCDLFRHANCFEFDRNVTQDCYGLNPCENGGQCFQDDPKCPTSSICVCDDCYYGTRCQFSTKGFRLSLDAILGYQIRLHVALKHQSLAVKTTVVFSTVMLVLALINGFLSILTFREEKTRDVGCGIYLLTLSIISIFTSIILTLKTSFLLASQIGAINNRSFIFFQCRSIDFLIRICLGTSDWLHACVAIERAVMILKGINFNKIKSKYAAKWIILIVLILNTITNIQELIYRHLIDDEEEKRTWCVTRYPTSIQIVDSVLNLIHFLSPFFINVVSAVVVIVTAARTRSTVQKTQTYKEHLREQLQNHKHLLISPCILIALALPRLIISFLSGCMKSTRNPWLYLCGYFLSFVSSVLTFIVFVLPSEMYKKQFSESFKRLCHHHH